MKISLYIFSGISLSLAIHELPWIIRSNLAIIISILAIIFTINSFVIAKILKDR